MGAKGKRTSSCSRKYVRMALKRYISHKYSNGQNFLPSYLLAPDVEDVRCGTRYARRPAAATWPWIRKKSQAFCWTASGAPWARSKQPWRRPAILTSMDIRRYARKLIEQDLYQPSASFPIRSWSRKSMCSPSPGGSMSHDAYRLVESGALS